MNAEAKAALRCTLAALAAAPLAGCGRKTSVEPAGIAWGDPVNGLQAGLLVEVVDTSHINGFEHGSRFRIHLTVYARNVGTSTIRIPPLSPTWELRTVGSGGRILPYHRPPHLGQAAPPPPPVVAAFKNLAPGARLGLCNALRALGLRWAIRERYRPGACFGPFRTGRPRADRRITRTPRALLLPCGLRPQGDSRHPHPLCMTEAPGLASKQP